MSFLEVKALKAFSQKPSVFFYDKRTKSIFRRFLAAPRPYNKYFFTDKTMDRINDIDLSNCKPTTLGFLFDKFENEVGVCMCKQDDLSFAYSINACNIQIIVFSGKVQRYSDENELFKKIIGSCIISYGKDIIDISTTNIFDIMDYSQNEKQEVITKGDVFFKQLKNIKNEIEKNNIKKLPENIDKTLLPYTYEYKKDLLAKRNKVDLAIKMFIFLKTSKILDKTFVSETTILGNFKQHNSSNNGLIVIDSFWDSNINVINPFSVSGHFRKQPYKDKNGEKRTEVIYIDSFMKKGYNRKAKKEQIESIKTDNHA